MNTVTRSGGNTTYTVIQFQSCQFFYSAFRRTGPWYRRAERGNSWQVLRIQYLFNNAPMQHQLMSWLYTCKGCTSNDIVALFLCPAIFGNSRSTY